jgi:hypothetical protein
LKWKRWIRGAKATDKMIFECLNRPFGGVDTMIVWFNQLDRAVLLLHECFDGCSSLIVCDVEDGFVPLVS